MYFGKQLADPLNARKGPISKGKELIKSAFSFYLWTIKLPN